MGNIRINYRNSDRIFVLTSANRNYKQPSLRVEYGNDRLYEQQSGNKTSQPINWQEFHNWKRGIK